MRIKAPLALLLLAVTAGPALAAPPHAPDRARANHEAILRGEKRLFDLTPVEQDEVRVFDKHLRAQVPPDTPDAGDSCQDAEFAKLGRAPTAADARAIAARCG